MSLKDIRELSSRTEIETTKPKTSVIGIFSFSRLQDPALYKQSHLFKKIICQVITDHY